MSLTLRSLAFITEVPKKKSFWDFSFDRPARSKYRVPHNVVTEDQLIDINDDFIEFYFYQSKYIPYINSFISRGYVSIDAHRVVTQDREGPTDILMNLAVVEKSNPVELAKFYDKHYHRFHDFSIYFTYIEVFKARVEENRTKHFIRL